MSDSAKKFIVFLSLGSLVLLGGGSFLLPNQQSAQVGQTAPPRIIKTEGGVLIEDIVPGMGKETVPGDMVSANYRGELENGRVFDSSYDRGQPLQFIIGTGQVIPGMEEGLLGMRVGGTRKLTIPPARAYGEVGIPGIIPGSATLIFTVELVNAESTGGGAGSLQIQQ